MFIEEYKRKVRRNLISFPGLGWPEEDLRCSCSWIQCNKGTNAGDRPPLVKLSVNSATRKISFYRNTPPHLPTSPKASKALKK